MTQSPSVFLSYRRSSSADLARYIHDRLITLGVDVFFDVEDINGGRFAAIIEKEIINRDSFLVILTPTTLDSEWVRKEFGVALRHQKNIIPLTTKDFDFDKHVPTELNALKDYSGIPYDYQDPNRAIERIKKALNIDEKQVKRRSPNLVRVGVGIAGIVMILALIMIAIPRIPIQPPDPSPTQTPSATSSPTPTFTATSVPPTATATLVPTNTPPPTIPTITPTLTYSPTATDTATFTPLPTETPSPKPNATIPTIERSTAVLPISPKSTVTPRQLVSATKGAYPCNGQVISSVSSLLNVVRARPTDLAPLVDPVRSGDSIIILNMTEGWYQVRYGELQAVGWIPSVYVVPSDSCPQ